MMDETYLYFRCGQVYYAVDYYRVLKILPAQDLYQLPIAEPYIKGVLKIEEKILAVFDLQQEDHENYYMILQFDDECLGICADEIMGRKVIKDDIWIVQDQQEEIYSYQEDNQNIYLLNLNLIKRRLQK